MARNEIIRFADRTEAGRLLGAKLRGLSLPRPVIYALPRGGVPVAAEIAEALGAPLDLILVRKIGAPQQPELALGAVVEGNPPETVLNRDIIALTGTDEAAIAAIRAREVAEINRRRAQYLAARPPIDPRGRAAVVVDDGLATGATARAALQALRRRGPARLVLAVPVAPPETLAALRREADEVVCLLEAELYHGISGHYVDFHQLEDEEVTRLLDAAAARHGGGPER
ncbi:phosphoribosyltransferase [Roseicella aerolata]|uniref:Phosphoribosyltransferase n=1 Tax=Roseicella aerolata TaxID=2883479 RepID=A0A9X1I999_9PROT|nr:phosphoribosyltransferase family protein [Roseicella aerolata]MCB4820272.1 phosphoribosyltransferase [Roseicella aerolata]